MSDHSHTPEAKADYFNPQRAGSLAAMFGAAGVLGLIISLVLGWFNPGQFAFSWLFATCFFFTLCMGALFWTLVHHATDAQWSVLVRRQLENVSMLIPVIGVFFLVAIAFIAPLLYKWWTMPTGIDPSFDGKNGYLSHGWFIGRAIFYFAIFSLLAWRLRRNSVDQDADGHPVYTIRMRKLGFIGIPTLGLGITFAAIDWLMSLDYHWNSTMWGVYIFAGAAGSALSLLVLILQFLQSSGHLRGVNQEHYHIIGKLMLAFCIFWAYIGFGQYMLYWYANIPEETSYFIRRNTETWWYLSTLLVVGHFFLPFPVLLFQAAKKTSTWIRWIAIWMLLMQLLDIYVVVLPILHVKGVSPSWLDLTTLIGIGGILGFFFMKSLPKTSLSPVRDPRLPESIHLSN